ncbi:MAG: hypothetical protein JWN72_752 [Thermoleophilia bacterium]|nr:hypothetical protein [Thermoleophilia bacterium]
MSVAITGPRASASAAPKRTEHSNGTGKAIVIGTAAATTAALGLEFAATQTLVHAQGQRGLYLNGRGIPIVLGAAATATIASLYAKAYDGSPAEPAMAIGLTGGAVAGGVIGARLINTRWKQVLEPIVHAGSAGAKATAHVGTLAGGAVRGALIGGFAATVITGLGAAALGYGRD